MERAMPSRSSGAWRKPFTPSCDHFGQPADAGGDDRHLAGHRLERREPEALLRRRQQEHVGSRQQRHDLILLAEEVDVVARRPSARASRARVGELGAVADHQQPGTALARAPARTPRRRPSPASPAGSWRRESRIFSSAGAQPRCGARGRRRRRFAEQSRKFGITRMSRVTPSSR